MAKGPTKSQLEQQIQQLRDRVDFLSAACANETRRVQDIRDGVGAAFQSMQTLECQLSKLAAECIPLMTKLAIEGMASRAAIIRDGLNQTQQRSYR